MADGGGNATKSIPGHGNVADRRNFRNLAAETCRDMTVAALPRRCSWTMEAGSRASVCLSVTRTGWSLLGTSDDDVRGDQPRSCVRARAGSSCLVPTERNHFEGVLGVLPVKQLNDQRTRNLANLTVSAHPERAATNVCAVVDIGHRSSE